MKAFHISALLAIPLFLIPVSFLNAADIRLGESVFIKNNEAVSENLYIASGQATVSGSVTGDVIIAGGKVIVNGSVTGDLLGTAGSIDILEKVSGDVRVAGGQVVIAAPVGGDVIIMGGSVHLLPAATVGGDLIVAGGDILIEGAVSKDARLYGGNVTLNGLVGGEVLIRAGDAVVFGENAVIAGKIIYTAPEEADVHPSAKLPSDITFNELTIPARSLGPTGVATLFASIAIGILLAKLLTALVTAVAAVLIFPGFSREIVDTTFENFWKSAGIGFAALLLVPAVAIFFAMTIVGLIGAAFLGILYTLVLLLAGVYAGIICGALIAKWVKKSYAVSWKWSLLGTLVISLISLIPLVGWIIVFVFFLAALGTISLGVYKRATGGM